MHSERRFHDRVAPYFRGSNFSKVFQTHIEHESFDVLKFGLVEGSEIDLQVGSTLRERKRKLELHAFLGQIVGSVGFAGVQGESDESSYFYLNDRFSNILLPAFLKTLEANCCPHRSRDCYLGWIGLLEQC